MKICIASNKEFFPQTFPVIIPSLLETGFLPNEIMVFVSGYDKRATTEIEGIQIIHLPYHSFEYSPLIDIVENQLESDWWFLLHDTCKTGPNFKKIITEFDKNPGIDTISVTKNCSGSIGAYRYSFLQSCKEKILNLKNTDTSKEGLQRFKKWTVAQEDYLLKRINPSINSYFGEGRKKIENYKEWYTQTNSPKRILEYYPQVDLYKVKGNWHTKPVYNLGL